MERALKRQLAKIVSRTGHKIERSFSLGDAALDSFELALKIQMLGKSKFRFFQVGANDGIFCDPIRDYVTRFAWSGVLMEPQAGPFANLVENYRGHAGLEFVNAALADRDGTAEFFTGEGSADACGGFDPNSVRTHGRGVVAKPITVKTVSMATLMQQYRLDDIDLLQVDVEGFDCKAVGLVLDAGIVPPIIRFEHLNVPHQEVETFCYRLAGMGYKMAKAGWDIVAVRFAL